MNPLDLPRIFFVLALLGLWFSVLSGAFIGQRVRPLKEDEREDFGVIQTALLTLLESVDWIHLLDGRQSIRPAEELRGSGGQRDRYGIRPGRPAAFS